MLLANHCWIFFVPPWLATFTGRLSTDNFHSMPGFFSIFVQLLPLTILVRFFFLRRRSTTCVRVSVFVVCFVVCLVCEWIVLRWSLHKGLLNPTNLVPFQRTMTLRGQQQQQHRTDKEERLSICLIYPAHDGVRDGRWAQGKRHACPLAV